jgi:protein-S-isoprenylcysteine O-methyltransferase Ste14
MDYIGKSPISVPILILGKVAFICCSVFFLVKMFAIDTMLFDAIFTNILGVIFYAVGLLTVIVSLLQLGRSATVGIPDRDTELKTHGMYRLTRNPVYVGAFMMCAGSCLFSIHIVNVLLMAITVEVHLRIVTKEEQFLEKRFGKQWSDYKQKVPRFVGRIRRSDSHSNSES